MTPLGYSRPSASSPSLGGCLGLGDWLELWSWESRQVCKGQPCSAVPPCRGWLYDLYEYTLPYTARFMHCTPSWNPPFLLGRRPAGTCRVTEHVWWEWLSQAVTQIPWEKGGRSTHVFFSFLSGKVENTFVCQLWGTPHSSASITYDWKQNPAVSKIHLFLKSPVISTFLPRTTSVNNRNWWRRSRKNSLIVLYTSLRFHKHQPSCCPNNLQVL